MTASGRRDLNLYWCGQTTSAFGSVFSAIAIPIIAVIHLGATPGQLSLITMAVILPRLLFGLPAGTLADRIVHPRRALIALDTVSALAVAVVCLGVAGDAASIGWLVALGAVQGCVGILLEVVYFIHLRQLTDDEGIGPARARLQAGQYAAGFVGRILAGPAIVAFGPATALLVDAASYLLSATALLSMSPASAILRTGDGERGNGIGDLMRSTGAGIRALFDNAFHRPLLTLLLASGLAGAGTSTLVAPFLLKDIRVPTEAYGLLFAGSGLLGLAGSMLAGRLLRPHRDPRLVTLASFATGAVCALLLPMATGPLPVAATIAALGISLPIFFGAITNVALSPVLVKGVAESATGRTLATLQVLAASAALFGALAGGLLGDRVGVRPALWIFQGGVVALLVLVLPRALRTARDLRDRAAVEAGDRRELAHEHANQ